MTIFEEIDRMFEEDGTDCNCRSEQILSELNEIKSKVQEIKNLLSTRYKARRKKDGQYYRFVEELRGRLYADVERGVYPEIAYRGRRLGVDAKGMVYDKSTQHILPTYEAFEVYDFLYENKNEIADYIKL